MKIPKNTKRLTKVEDRRYFDQYDFVGGPTTSGAGTRFSPRGYLNVLRTQRANTRLSQRRVEASRRRTKKIGK